MTRFRGLSLIASFAVALASAFLYLTVIHPMKVFEISRLKTTDSYFKLREALTPPPKVLNQITLVMVDASSIARLHAGWPLQRGLYADLIEKIMPYNPRVIGMDFIFAAEGQRLDDVRLIEAMRKSGRVIVVSFIDEEGRYHVSRPEFLEAAAGSGIANTLSDADLTTRRTTLFYQTRLFYQGQDLTFFEWSWAARNLIHFLGLSPSEIRIAEKEVVFPKGVFPNGERKEVRVPLLQNGSTLINYRFQLEDVERIPLWRVLQDKFPEQLFRGKIVLVGATSKDLHDYFRTPLGFMPGVLMHANFLANLLEGDFLTPVPEWVNALLIFVFVGLAFWTSLRFDLAKSLLCLITELSLATGIGVVFFFNHWVVDLFTPVVEIGASFLLITLSRYFLTLVENIRLRGEVVTDPLTGLYTRRFLQVRLDQELAKLAAAEKKSKTDPFVELSVLMIDVDHFKRFNDTYGHPFGDEVLRKVGGTIRESIRRDDVIVRYGGEEFCVVLARTGKTHALQIGEKIRRAAGDVKLNYANQEVSFTVSIGVASARADHLSESKGLIQAADIALYEAKGGGRNRVVSYNKT